MVIGWSFTINPQTHKDVYLLHLVTQNIVNETSILFSTKDLYYFQQKKKYREVKEFGKTNIKFIKILLRGFTNQTRISEGPFNNTKRLTKT